MDLHYNAFISYRHHPEDIKVAETIHRSLERFKVPKALKQQGKSIERIFRDKEELPITSSLTDTITMALRNSDYQIVICSTHLKDSYWVQREIETFLQTHTKDKVLTVLVDGDNPYDVIPEILTYNEVVDPVTGEITREPIEPLSCDWRMSKRKAMKTELPRLAAVLLGCTYDDLIQRQKQYRQRRLIAGISTGMAASLALAGYFLYTSIQIQENLNQSLRNQSQYLASASQEKFDKGDRLSALALAMAALPSEEDERPYVASAEQALGDALMLYEADGELISVASFDAESSIQDFVVTDDGTMIYILNDQHHVSAWDTIEMKKLSTFNIIGIQFMDSVMLTDNNNNLLTLGGPEGDILYSYTPDGTLQWKLDAVEDIAFTEDKEILLVLHGVRNAPNDITPEYYELMQLNPENGEILEEPFAVVDHAIISTPYLSTDTYYKGQPVAIHGYSTENDRVIVANPKTRSSRTVLEYDTFFYGASVTDDGNLYFLLTDSNEVTNGRMSSYYFYTKEGAWLYSFDMNSGKLNWKTYITAYNYSEANMIAPIPNSDRLFCQYGSAFLQVDAKSGKILEECHSTAIPLTVQMRETTAWVLYTNGCAGTYAFDTNTIGYFQYMESGLTMGHNNKGIYVVPPLTSTVLLYRTTADESYIPFSGEYDDYIDQLRIQGTLMATYGSGFLNLFDLSTNRLLWKIEPGYSFYLLGFSADETALYAKKYKELYRFDLSNGEFTTAPLYEDLELSNFTEYYNVFAYYGDTLCTMVHPYYEAEPHFIFFNCNTGEYTIVPFTVEEDTSIWTNYDHYPKIFHMDDTFILFRSGIGNLYRFDRTTQTVQQLPAVCSSVDPVVGINAETEQMALRTDEGILLLDSAGNMELTIPLKDMFAVSMYFYEDLLLFLSSDGAIYRYDMDGKLVGKTSTSGYSSFFTEVNNLSLRKIPVTWGITPDNEIVVNLFRMGNIINTEYWERTGDVPQLVFYDNVNDRFICQSNDMIYSYERCSLDEILAKAKDELMGFELSEAQKAYYGLTANSD